MAYVSSVNPDKSVHLCSLIRLNILKVHTFCLDSDKIVGMCRLIRSVLVAYAIRFFCVYRGSMQVALE